MNKEIRIQTKGLCLNFTLERNFEGKVNLAPASDTEIQTVLKSLMDRYTSKNRSISIFAIRQVLIELDARVVGISEQQLEDVVTHINNNHKNINFL